MSSDESRPVVSVGLPVYNGERYLAEGIESTLAQTYSDLELIISDNGSTDATPMIASEYARKDRRVRFYRSDSNNGAAWNYNHVFALARGRYFRWAPADDKFHPESVAECVAVLEAHPDVVLCYPQTILIDSEGSEIGTYDDDLDLRFEDVVQRFRAAIRRNGLVSAMYGLMRSDAMRRTALFPGHPGSDVTFLAELTLHGRFVEIPRPLFFRRMHEAASTSLTSIEAVQEWFDPRRKDQLILYHWTHLLSHVRSALRAPLSARDRTRVIVTLLRWLVECRDKFGPELLVAFRRFLGRRSETRIAQGKLAGRAKTHGRLGYGP